MSGVTASPLPGTFSKPEIPAPYTKSVVGPRAQGISGPISDVSVCSFCLFVFISPPFVPFVCLLSANRPHLILPRSANTRPFSGPYHWSVPVSCGFLTRIYRFLFLRGLFKYFPSLKPILTLNPNGLSQLNGFLKCMYRFLQACLRMHIICTCNS